MMCCGMAQISPGIFEPEGEQTVYFQTVGSIAALVMVLSNLKGWKLNPDVPEAEAQILKNLMYEDVSPAMNKCLEAALEQSNHGWLMIIMLVIARLGKAFSVNKEVGSATHVQTSSSCNKNSICYG